MASISWKSGVSGSWTNSTYWTPASVPGVADDVTISSTGTYTVSAVSATSAKSITINAAGATLAETNTLSLGGLLSITAGTFSLAGTIIGGTIAPGGGTFQVNSGTLNSVNYRGALNLATSGVSLSIVGSLGMTGTGGTGAGTVNLIGTSALLGFVGSQTFDNATVNLGSTVQASAAKLTEKDLTNSGATLTLGSGLTVLGSGGYGMLQSTNTPGTAGLINNGTIAFGTSGGLIEVSANTFANQGRMTVSNAGSLYLLTGPYGVPSGAVGSNSGSITLSNGLLAFGNTFTNTGSVIATGGTITIGGTFATTGTFIANNTKLTIGGTISGASLLALLNNSSDTVTYSAIYDNTGAVLNIGSGTSIGTLSLTSSLPIRNGTIADAGGGFLFSGGTLTAVAYQGTMDLSRNGSSLNIATSLTARQTGGTGLGSVKITGTSSTLSFLGTQSFNNAIVTLGSSTQSAIAKFQEKDSAGIGATLTLGSALQIVSNGGSGLILSTNTIGNASLINLGTIQVGSAGGLLEVSANQFTNSGKMSVGSTGTLAVLTGPYTPPPGETGVNNGTITGAGGVVSIGGTFVNNGSINVNGGTLTVSGTFIDAGSLTVNNATVNLGGLFTGVSLLRAMNNASDTVNVTGTYDNTGGTLYVGSGTSLGTIDLVNGLPISNGTIVDTGGGLLFDGGTLDGVTYVGTLSLGYYGALDVMDGLVVQSGSGPGTVNLTGGWSSMNFLNAQSLNNMIITLGDASGFTDSLYNLANGTVTLGSGLVVQQTVGISQIYDYATALTLNRGAILVSGGSTFQILGNGGNFTNAGSIAVSGGASFGAYAFLGSSGFTNTGVLTATTGANVILEAGWDNTGTISVNGATLQLGSDNVTAWTNIGRITATNATLELEGAFTTAQLRQLSLSNTQVQIVGALSNTGTLLSVGGTTALGGLLLNEGTITGGTIVDTGGGVQFGSGTLDGVTYFGAVTVGASGSLWVQDGLTLLQQSGSGNGSLSLAGGSSGLIVLDTETLDYATVTMGDATGDTDYIENYGYGSPNIVTLGSHLTIQQNVGDAAIYTVGGGATVNNGRINVSGGATFHVDYGVFTNAGTISLSGATTQFNDNTAPFTNSGTMTATGGAGIALQAGWVNTGTISVNGGDLQLGSDTTTTWGTIGTINATNAEVDLYGSFTTAQVKSLNLSGVNADVDGVLSNAGGTLNIGAGAALATLGPAVGGIIRGGVIVDAGSGMNATGGTLDGVTYRGTLAIGAADVLNVVNSLTVQTGGQAGTISLTGGGSTLAVLDNETLDNATIVIGDASGTTDILSNAGFNGTTLVLGANLVLQQSTGSAQLLSTGASDVVTGRGQVVVTGGTLDISGGTFTNAGTISVSGGGKVMFEPGSLGNFAGSTLSGGVYKVFAGSTLQFAPSNFVNTLAADVTLSGAGSSLQALNSTGSQVGIDGSIRTIAVGGALRLLSGRSLYVSGSLVDQGVLQLGGGTLTATSTVTVAGTLVGNGTINGSVANAQLIEANGGVLTISGASSGAGQFQIDSNGTLELVTTSAIASNFSGSGGTLLLDRPTTYTGAIGGFALGDSIVLNNVTASTATIQSGTLSVNLIDGSTLSYAVGGSFTGLAVRTALTSVGTTVTLAAAAPAHITGLLDNRGQTLQVSSSNTVELDGGTVLGGTIADSGGGFVVGFGTLDGVTYRGSLSVGAGGLLNVVDGLITPNYSGGSPGAIKLTGGGSTLTVLDSETLDNATLSIGDASGTTDILANGGANGNTLTLGANLVLQQATGSAQLLGNGTADLTVNNGQILVSGGTLGISGGTFTNTGTIKVSGGGTVMFDPATLNNFSGGTLTGGTYWVGTSSTLQLPKSSFIATLAADVTLNGTNSVMQSVNSSGVQNLLETNLRTVASTGALRLLGGRSMTIKAAFAEQGLVQIGGGTLSTTSTLTLSGTLIGFGTVSGSLADNGLIEANGGRLVISNVTTGTGLLQIDSAATLELATTSALASGFNGTNGTLQLDKPTTYTGIISGFNVGNTIVLAGVTANSASITGNTLNVSLTTGKTLSYNVAGSFGGKTVQTSSIAGNTNVTLVSSGAAPQQVSAATASVMSAARVTVAGPDTAQIGASQLSLTAAGFLDAKGHIAGHVVAATVSGQSLNGTVGLRDVFTGTVATFNHDVIAQLAGSGPTADLVDITDLAFASAIAHVTSNNGRTTLSFTDGQHAGSLSLAQASSAAHFTMMNDGHGGTLFAHH